MRKLFMMAALVAAAVFPTASHAQFQLGLRVGYAPAMGDAYKDNVTGVATKMSDGVKSQIPLQLDGMYKLNPEVKIGAYLSYGFVSTGGDLKTACDVSGVSCSTSEYRAGVQATYAFTKASPKFVPWAGLGLGYEWSGYSREAAGVKFEQSLNGFELGLQVGGDYKVNEKFSVGPYLGYSFGQYSGGEQKVTGAGALDETVKFSDFADKAVHSWFGFGVVGKYDI